MVFSDLFFLFVFLPLFFGSYMLASLVDKKWLTSHKCRNITLVLFSLFFYAWGEPVYVFLMLALVLLNFYVGKIIDSTYKHRKIALNIGVILNVLALGIFKYASITVLTLNSFGFSLNDPKIALPIGISFYIFQSISYLIDVYKKESPAQRNFMDLLLYISMFPQLIAGPIVRYGTIASEIHDRKVSISDIADGAFRFIYGLGKKVIIANQMSIVAEQFLVHGFENCTTTGAWVGIFAYSLQVYFDFSGYSDMAIGIGRCMGFHFNENFKHPYCCNSITDFWHRWHISLGSFFRDYVYIPLGGNRRHQWFNILATWFLTGFWHGASWNFACWGLYFGIILLFEKYTLMKNVGQPLPTPDAKGRPRYRKVMDFIPSPLLHLYAMGLVTLGRGLFYFTDFSQMKVFFAKAFGQVEELHSYISISAITDHFWLWIVAILLCMPVREWCYNHLVKLAGKESALTRNTIFITRSVLSLAIIILSVALLIGETNNPFIYTRF
jgi:alginate O-acetyltransferase complex protein AlgI